jgi:hypothetical protein
LLLHDLPCSQDFFEACNAAEMDQKGINLVHELSFEPNKVTMSFFSNLDMEKKEIEPNKSWPTANYAVGKVTNCHLYEGEPTFFPFKQMIQDDRSKKQSQLDPCLLSTKLI